MGQTLGRHCTPKAEAFEDVEAHGDASLKEEAFMKQVSNDSSVSTMAPQVSSDSRVSTMTHQVSSKSTISAVAEDSDASDKKWDEHFGRVSWTKIIAIAGDETFVRLSEGEEATPMADEPNNVPKRAYALSEVSCKNDETLVETSRRRSLTNAAEHVYSKESNSTVERVCHKDISRLALLGCGAHGTVYLVQHNVKKKHYSLKSINKGSIAIAGEQSAAMNEKTTQMLCSSPFIVKLHETFNEYDNLFFLSELMLGGELRTAYKRNGLVGSTAHCQYYVASAVYALEHMHERDIIFRDLKPENMLLSAAGRMKVTDFGLAKVSAGKTYTLCGTSAYCAPEMRARTGHTQAVDWWAVGMITFELMMGERPFAEFGSSSNKKFWRRVIRNGIELPDIKHGHVFAGVSGEHESFVRDLSRLSPMERIPMKAGGIDNIKKHPWFQEFQWAALLDGTCEPPYKPCVASDTDLSNFECVEDRLPPTVDYEGYDDGSMWDADFATSA